MPSDTKSLRRYHFTVERTDVTENSAEIVVIAKNEQEATDQAQYWIDHGQVDWEETFEEGEPDLMLDDVDDPDEEEVEEYLREERESAADDPVPRAEDDRRRSLLDSLRSAATEEHRVRLIDELEGLL